MKDAIDEIKLPRTKEEFHAYASKHDWFLIHRNGTPQGKQEIFMTPSGEPVIGMFDIKGDFVTIAKPVMQAIPQSQGVPKGLFGPGFRHPHHQ